MLVLFPSDYLMQWHYFVFKCGSCIQISFGNKIFYKGEHKDFIWYTDIGLHYLALQSLILRVQGLHNFNYSMFIFYVVISKKNLVIPVLPIFRQVMYTGMHIPSFSPEEGNPMHRACKGRLSNSVTAPVLSASHIHTSSSEKNLFLLQIEERTAT